MANIVDIIWVYWRIKPNQEHLQRPLLHLRLQQQALRPGCPLAQMVLRRVLLRVSVSSEELWPGSLWYGDPRYIHLSSTTASEKINLACPLVVKGWQYFTSITRHLDDETIGRSDEQKVPGSHTKLKLYVTVVGQHLIMNLLAPAPTNQSWYEFSDEIVAEEQRGRGYARCLEALAKPT